MGEVARLSVGRREMDCYVARPATELVGGILVGMASALAIFGSDDDNPSPSDRDQLEATLKAHGLTHHVESYDGAGHAFLNFTRPEMYREQQAKSAWDLCTNWLGKEMSTGV